MGLTYQLAGVDIDAGNELVKRIKQLKTDKEGKNWQVVGGIGGFSGLYQI